MAELIALSDERGKVLPYVRQLLDALTFFPDDDLSFKICRFAIEQEYREYLKRGPETLIVSRVTEVLIHAAEKRATQVHVAGLVALAMFGLKVTGKRASQEAAVGLVSEYNYRANEFLFERWDRKAGERIEILKAVQGEPSSIRKIFTQFRSVAHLCAARVSSTDYLQPLPLFEPAGEADASKLATILAFQDFFLSEIKDAGRWHLRLIECPASVGPNSGILEPQRELMEAVLGKPN